MGCSGSKDSSAITQSSGKPPVLVEGKTQDSLDSSPISAKPAFVVKLSGDQKIFVNVYGDDQINKIFIYPKKETCTDRKGAQCVLYSVLLPSKHAFKTESRPTVSV